MLGEAPLGPQVCIMIIMVQLGWGTVDHQVRHRPTIPAHKGVIASMDVAHDASALSGAAKAAEEAPRQQHGQVILAS